jgi:hypothetical protein
MLHECTCPLETSTNEPSHRFIHQALYRNQPTCLVKILGVYQVHWKKPNQDKMEPTVFVVMPNLFFNRKIGRVFDLKGSMRNRYERKENSVGLDQNFLEFTRGFPLPLRESSKEHLKVCVHNDTLFLTNAQVIDYSLLVGFDEQSNELVVGIIDYIRLYTWDKQIETGVKLLTFAFLVTLSKIRISRVALVRFPMTNRAQWFCTPSFVINIFLSLVPHAHGCSQTHAALERSTNEPHRLDQHAPTIINPENYKLRFRKAMDRYFMVVPDRNSLLPEKEHAAMDTGRDDDKDKKRGGPV